MLQTGSWLPIALIILAWSLILGGVVGLAFILAQALKSRPTTRETDIVRQAQTLQDKAVQPHNHQGRRAVLGLGATLLGSIALWTLDHTNTQHGTDPTTSSAASTPHRQSPTPTALSITDFGAKGDGIADDGPALRRALEALRKQGGGILYLSSGIYQCGVQPIPTDTKRAACGWIPSNSRLVGDGSGSTVIRLAPESPNQALILCNFNQGGALDKNISVEHLTVDGNAGQQNKHIKVDGHKGLVFTHVTGITVRDVLFRNVFGLSSGSAGPGGTPAEGFHTDCVGCSEILYESCQVQSDRNLPAASGFSLNGSARAVYRDSTASGLQFGQGFTHWRTMDVVYEACRAYNCLQDGFHSEYASSITYVACTSGKNWLAPYSPGSSAQTTPGNRIGFHIYSGKDILIAHCIGRGNVFHGARIELTDRIRIVGGAFTGNAQYGIRLDEAQTVSQAVIEGMIDLTDNDIAPIWYANQVTQYRGPLKAPTLPASGVPLVNPFPFEITVYVGGGNVSRVLVEGNPTGVSSGAFRLRPAGGRITLFYSSPPSWSWFSV